MKSYGDVVNSTFVNHVACSPGLPIRVLFHKDVLQSSMGTYKCRIGGRRPMAVVGPQSKRRWPTREPFAGTRPHTAGVYRDSGTDVPARTRRGNS